MFRIKQKNQEEMLFKDISYLELWQPLLIVDHNQMCNFGRVHQKEQFCEIILNFDQWIRRRWKFGSLLLNTRPIGPSVTKHIRHITNKVTAD